MTDVSCAIIIHNHKILVAQRSATMSLPFKWEFPGGKAEPGESVEEALIREIREELDIAVMITGKLEFNIHTYGTKTIRLIPFTCEMKAGEKILLKEHQSYLRLSSAELLHLDWAEADIPIVKAFLNQYDEF